MGKVQKPSTYFCRLGVWLQRTITTVKCVSCEGTFEGYKMITSTLFLFFCFSYSGHLVRQQESYTILVIRASGDTGWAGRPSIVVVNIHDREVLTAAHSSVLLPCRTIYLLYFLLFKKYTHEIPRIFLLVIQMHGSQTSLVYVARVQ